MHEKKLRYLVKKVKKAQKDFLLFSEGDKIGVGLSGGKDSMALVLLLNYYEKISPIKFDFFPIHVQWENQKDDTYKSLMSFFQPYHIEIHRIIVPEDVNWGKNPCFRCSWKRREALFRYCIEHGWNKLALGHHQDDVAETTIMNLFFHATLDTMEPKLSFFEDKIILIRPMIFTPEKEIAAFSKILNYPFHTCTCPKKKPGQREKIKKILRSFGRQTKTIQNNLWQASRRWQNELRRNPKREEEL